MALLLPLMALGAAFWMNHIAAGPWVLLAGFAVALAGLAIVLLVSFSASVTGLIPLTVCEVKRLLAAGAAAILSAIQQKHSGNQRDDETGRTARIQQLLEELQDHPAVIAVCSSRTRS